jgi:N-carbamoyl-L-amino-acid hydrolase
MEAAFRAVVAEVVARRGVQVEVRRVGGYPRVPFAPALLDALRRAADAAQVRHRDMPGPIPQDALHVGIVVPSALMFIPCHGGVSHHPSESISREWCAAGLTTMGPAVIEAAGGLA